MVASSASIIELRWLRGRLLPLAPVVDFGEPASSGPTEIVLARLTVPDSGVYLWASLAGCEECLDEEAVAGGVGSFSLGGAGGLFSPSLWVDSGGDTSEAVTC